MGAHREVEAGRSQRTQTEERSDSRRPCNPSSLALGLGLRLGKGVASKCAPPNSHSCGDVRTEWPGRVAETPLLQPNLIRALPQPLEIKVCALWRIIVVTSPKPSSITGLTMDGKAKRLGWGDVNLIQALIRYLDNQ